MTTLRSSTLVLVLSCCSVYGQSSAGLSIDPATAYTNGTISTNLSLTAGTPAGLEWTLNYSTSDFTAFTIQPAPGLTAGGNTLSCNETPGSATCIVYGMNPSNALADGVVAVVNLTVAPATSSTPASRSSTLGLVNAISASTIGDAIPTSASNGTITILKPTPSVVTPGTVSLSAQKTQQFTADGSAVWSINPAVGSISTSGLYTAPALVSGSQQVVVTAANPTNSAISASATISLLPASVQAAPATASIVAGGTQQFTATVSNAPNTAVTWSINPAVGSISASGLYTAPSTLSAAQKITVTATSAFDPAMSATASVTVSPAAAIGVSVNPAASSLSASQTQQFTASVTGTTNQAVTWSVSPSIGTISSSGLYTAPGSISTSSAVTVTATSAADPTKSASASITLNPTTTMAAVSPSQAMLGPGQQQQFSLTATAAGTQLAAKMSASATSSVNWSISPAMGTISSTGLYSAPTNISSSQAVAVTATVNGVAASAAKVMLEPPVATSGAITIDARVSKDQSRASSTVTTPAFSTVSGNELLLAFISTDSASSTNAKVNSISGGGLTWVLVVRSNGQLGTSEIWRAFAPTPLANVSVQASLSQSVVSSLTVLSYKGVDTSGTNGSGAIGAFGTSNASSGTPSASLTTTRNNSWVFGAGNDWDKAVSRTPGTGQSIVHQYLAPVGDTYWVQAHSAPTPLAGTKVTINDSSPAADRFNLSVCEVLPAK